MRIGRYLLSACFSDVEGLTFVSSKNGSETASSGSIQSVKPQPQQQVLALEVHYGQLPGTCGDFDSPTITFPVRSFNL